MKQHKAPRPPKWAARMLALYCRQELLEDLEGDLNEYFDRHVKSKGLWRARLIYVVDVLKFFRLYTLRKPSIINLLTQWIMIGNYFKTARRTMVRNKLFSFINVVGLAVSMSVGLLVIAYLSDLLSYDDFHEKKDRIYRITTTDQRDGQRPMTLASTSARAGKGIVSSVAGIEAVTLMRNGFGGEVMQDGVPVSIGGLWADEHFFKIFSFPLIEGNAATALREPYAVVLTEKAAYKLFGKTRVTGMPVRIGKDDYIVTGVLKDLPALSHLRFEALGSFSTVEVTNPVSADGEFMSWGNIYSNYVYLTLPAGGDLKAVAAGVSRLCTAENAALDHRQITLNLQPLKSIAINKRLENEIGPVEDVLAIWILSGLAFVVILCACFNYTNLSIARALRRSREVGIRKIVGAHRRQVLAQFVAEAVLVALLSLGLSFVIFIFLRGQFIGLSPHLERLVVLELSPRVVVYFVALAVVTGTVAGVFPALLFSRLQITQALKDASSLRLFRHINMRKALVVVQYVFSIVFITTTVIGYNQYKSFLVFDLGFDTANIINIDLHGNDGKLLAHELKALPAVVDISRSVMITSLGSKYGTSIRYNDTRDSSNVLVNIVDDRYLPVHGHTLLAGRNFLWKPDSVEDREIIVNEQLIKRFNIAGGNMQNALGEELHIMGRRLAIAGVVKDFHYGTVSDVIEPTVFIYKPGEHYGHLNVKITGGDVPATLAAIEAVWKKVDKVHPMDARFYDDQIEEAYHQFVVMVKVIGFLAFLAICIASLGLLGMVVFTTETRLKEISIRKVLGASERGLMVQLSRSFLVLLVVASAIALPVTYLFFDRVVLSDFAYHAPIGIVDMVTGVLCVTMIALVMIVSQALRVVRVNPADTLKSD